MYLLPAYWVAFKNSYAGLDPTTHEIQKLEWEMNKHGYVEDIKKYRIISNLNIFWSLYYILYSTHN